MNSEQNVVPWMQSLQLKGWHKQGTGRSKQEYDEDNTPDEIHLKFTESRDIIWVGHLFDVFRSGLSVIWDLQGNGVFHDSRDVDGQDKNLGGEMGVHLLHEPLLVIFFIGCGLLVFLLHLDAFI